MDEIARRQFEPADRAAFVNRETRLVGIVKFRHRLFAGRVEFADILARDGEPGRIAALCEILRLKALQAFGRLQGSAGGSIKVAHRALVAHITFVALRGQLVLAKDPAIGFGAEFPGHRVGKDVHLADLLTDCLCACARADAFGIAEICDPPGFHCEKLVDRSAFDGILAAHHVALVALAAQIGLDPEVEILLGHAALAGLDDIVTQAAGENVGDTPGGHGDDNQAEQDEGCLGAQEVPHHGKHGSRPRKVA